MNNDKHVFSSSMIIIKGGNNCQTKSALCTNSLNSPGVGLQARTRPTATRNQITPMLQQTALALSSSPQVIQHPQVLYVGKQQQQSHAKFDILYSNTQTKMTKVYCTMYCTPGNVCEALMFANFTSDGLVSKIFPAANVKVLNNSYCRLQYVQMSKSQTLVMVARTLKWTYMFFQKVNVLGGPAWVRLQMKWPRQRCRSI